MSQLVTHLQLDESNKFSHNIINEWLITHSYALGFTAQDGLVTTPYMTMYLIVNTLRCSLCCTFTQYHGLFIQDFIALLIEIDPRRGTTTVAP